MRQSTVVLLVLVLFSGLAPCLAAGTAVSVLGNSGAAFETGMTPELLGWGTNEDPYPDRIVVYPPDGTELVWVPAGEFEMGSNNMELERVVREMGASPRRVEPESPDHRVLISRGFWLGRHEVTVGQYRGFAEGTGRRWVSPYPDQLSHPVTYVSWLDAAAYTAHYHQRLPTEAEWEYAARGRARNWWASGSVGAHVRCHDTNPGPNERSMPVCSFPTGLSWCGAHDMAGNAVEWCADWYDQSYYSSSPSVDPRGPEAGKERVLKGGSFGGVDIVCRAAYRYGFRPDGNGGSFGFRVCVAAE